MTLWWYVPGVSSSRRRSSRFDGFASSSSWKTVMIPNTLPSTAKLPTARTTESTALTIPTPPAAGSPSRSRCSSRLKASDHDHVRHGQRDEDPHERVEPLGAGDRQERRDAAREDVHRQLERVAVHDAGQHGETDRHRGARPSPAAGCRRGARWPMVGTRKASSVRSAAIRSATALTPRAPGRRAAPIGCGARCPARSATGSRPAAPAMSVAMSAFPATVPTSTRGGSARARRASRYPPP